MITKKYFFVGVGGVGMSSIASYMLDCNHEIFGYDRVSNSIIESLKDKGMIFTDKEDIKDIPSKFLEEDVIVVFTPAIKENNLFLKYFRSNSSNKIFKRSEILGEISKQSICIAVGGTHGKTTTTSILSHLFYCCNIKFKSFVGGVMKGYNSNYINTGDKFVIIEADEYDRSFHKLDPDYILITSIEEDHLDIYKDYESLFESFKIFSEKAKSCLITEEEIKLNKDYSFSINNDADYMALNISNERKGIRFDFKSPNGLISNIYFNLIGEHNLKNALSALSIIDQIDDLDIHQFIPHLSTFKGIERRMNIFSYKNKILIDDYAHHPSEIKAISNTLKSNYSNLTKAVIFQPHLFSRTRDFMDEFARVLSDFDEVYLLNIYPAREEPIKGVSSQVLMEKIDIKIKMIIESKDINDIIEKTKCKIISILGAGDLTKNINKNFFESV